MDLPQIDRAPGPWSGDRELVNINTPLLESVCTTGRTRGHVRCWLLVGCFDVGDLYYM